MSELEEKLNSLLSNPQMMQQIMSLAQSIHTEPREPAREAAGNNFSLPDPAMLQNLTQAAGQMAVDSNQQALLQALSPYLSQQRVQKLERAMQAAKMAGAASLFLNAGGLQMLTGR